VDKSVSSSIGFVMLHMHVQHIKKLNKIYGSYSSSKSLKRDEVQNKVTQNKFTPTKVSTHFPHTVSSHVVIARQGWTDYDVAITLHLHTTFVNIAKLRETVKSVYKLGYVLLPHGSVSTHTVTYILNLSGRTMARQKWVPEDLPWGVKAAGG
jgi:hypothetical protein